LKYFFGLFRESSISHFKYGENTEKDIWVFKFAYCGHHNLLVCLGALRLINQKNLDKDGKGGIGKYLSGENIFRFFKIPFMREMDRCFGKMVEKRFPFHGKRTINGFSLF